MINHIELVNLWGKQNDGSVPLTHVRSCKKRFMYAVAYTEIRHSEVSCNG